MNSFVMKKISKLVSKEATFFRDVKGFNYIESISSSKKGGGTDVQ